jgi:hypothetical protein
MAVRYLDLLFHSPNILITNLCVSIQRGDEALAGREEKDIPSHRFPPTTHDRKICFKGYYLSIYNEQTEDYKTHIVNETPTTEYVEYQVPAGYTIYIRGASVYFTKS